MLLLRKYPTKLIKKGTMRSKLDIYVLLILPHVFFPHNNDTMCNSLRIRQLSNLYITDNNERTKNKNIVQISENNYITQQSGNKSIPSHGVVRPRL